jgi:hypothetical protein
MPAMKQVSTIPLVLLLAGLLASIASAASQESREKELQREQSKFEKETDPVDRAKIGIRICELLIEDVGDAVRTGDYSEMEMQLAAYTTAVETVHQGLINSGRNAAKKPSGFKELEIALRKQARTIDDLARMLNLEKRIPLEKTKTLVTGIRDKLLKALFP